MKAVSPLVETLHRNMPHGDHSAVQDRTPGAHDSLTLALIGACLLAAIVADYLAPWPWPMTPLYALPVLIAAHTLAPRTATVVATLIIAVNILSGAIQGTPPVISLLYTLGLVVIACLAILLAHRQRQITRYARANAVLRNSFLSVLGQRTLAAADLTTLMDAVVAVVAHTLHVEYASVLELLPDSATLLLRAGLGWRAAQVGQATVSAESGSEAGDALLADGPLIIEDRRRAARFGESSFLHDHGVVSRVSVRIEGRERTFGILGAYTTEQRAFSRDDAEFMATMANVLARVLERVHSEDAMREAEALRRTEELQAALLSSLSHDLRTPLASIKTAVTILLGGAAPTQAAERRELLQGIDEETDRLTRLVCRLLDLSRIEGGAVRLQKEQCDVAELLTSLAERLDPHGDRVRLQVPADRPLARLDNLLVEQVITNLVENALKYSSPGTPVEVTAEVHEGQLRITIADRGPGIPPTEATRIFEKFYRTTAASAGASGTGLGLAIARGLARAHGGDVSFAPRPDGGSIFIVSLPIEGSE
jgi:two-component system sensor histidine kinase KdpD